MIIHDENAQDFLLYLPSVNMSLPPLHSIRASHARASRVLESVIRSRGGGSRVPEKRRNGGGDGRAPGSG
jgi:hypothetical protein